MKIYAYSERDRLFIIFSYLSCTIKNYIVNYIEIFSIDLVHEILLKIKKINRSIKETNK